MKKKPTKSSKELNNLKPKHKKAQQKTPKIRQEELEELKSFRTKKQQEPSSSLTKRKKTQEITGGRAKKGGTDVYIPTGNKSAPRPRTQRYTKQSTESQFNEDETQYISTEGQFNEDETEYIPTLTMTGELLDQLNFYKNEYESSLSFVQRGKAKLMDDFIFIVNRNSSADKEGYEEYLKGVASEIFDNLTELYNDSKQEEIQTDYTSVSSALNYGDGYYIRD